MTRHQLKIYQQLILLLIPLVSILIYTSHYPREIVTAQARVSEKPHQVAPTPTKTANRTWDLGKFTRFLRLTSEDGLSSDYILRIAQDRDGFIWFGTFQGLNRYDGDRIKVFAHDPKDPHSLSGNMIRALHIGPTGTMWIGTWENGLNQFDPARESFIRYEHDQHGLSIIYNSGNHLLTLINDILDLAKIEAGKTELHPQPVNFPDLLNGVADVITMTAHQKQLQFSFEKDAELPVWVQVDEKRLRQVLFNLLGNAVKFTHNGQISFRVSRVASNTINQQPAVQICFEIRDTGVGINPEQIAIIFHPFEQVCDGLKRAEGTGLGLAISRQLVNLMGGEIQVSSEKNQGSTFWFEISLAIASDALKNNHAVPTNTREIVGYQGKRQKILVVDDKLENRMVLLDLLDPLGFEIILGKNGREGLDYAKMIHPDLILVDLVMPVMTGFEMIHQIRQTPEMQNLPIFAVSASAFTQDRQQIFKIGCQEFLSKPIVAEILFSMIEKYLDIEWIYGSVDSSVEISLPGAIADETIIIPPQEDLEALYELTMFGDLGKVQAKVNAMAQISHQYRAFTQTIREYAEKLEDEPILELLTKYINTNHNSR